MVSKMTPKDQHEKCEKCEYGKVFGSSCPPFRFIGCCYKPYKGKWVAEIEKCPKDGDSNG